MGLIMAGKVFVDEVVVDKPGTLVSSDATIRINTGIPFVSRGGYKLQEALDRFQLSPSHMTCIDIGVSTGGFTDCLLQNGAVKVYCVDVGYGQIDWKLRQDSRVILFERCNARTLAKEKIPDPIDLAVIDVSFISLTKIIPPLLPLFNSSISIIALIKPQFELPKEQVEKGGIVRQPSLHQIAIEKIKQFGKSLGLKSSGVVPSPISGAKGNREFLIHLEGANKKI